VGEWFSGKRGIKLVWRSALFALVLVLIQLAVMIRFGWLRDWFPGISQWFVLLFNPATLTAGLFIGLAEWIRRRSGSTRMAALALFTSSLVALVIFYHGGDLVPGAQLGVLLVGESMAGILMGR
jgi:hypothetical protein